MERSMNDVPSSRITAKCGATPNRTRVFKSPRQSYKRIEPSSASGCFDAVRKEGKLFRFMRFARSRGIISDRIKCTPVSVSRIQTDVCINVVEISYDTRILYVSLDVRAKSVDVGANYRGSRLSAILRFGLIAKDWLCGRLNETHGCKGSGLSAVGVRGVVLAILRAVGVVNGACGTSGGRVTLSRGLPWGPHSSSFSGSSHKFSPVLRLVSVVRRRRSLGVRD